jgi:CubicO group peptidase (beta-lactamase class C family)
MRAGPHGEAGSHADRFDAIRAWLDGHVASGRLPGADLLVAQAGRVLFREYRGLRSVERGAPVERDTIFRIYSMTKPVTAVAALALVEAGALRHDDPVSRYIPSFAALTVNRLGAGERIEAEPAHTPMTVLHLLTHTSGLTYGEGNPGAVARLYERERTDFGPGDGPLAEVVDRLARIPLLFEPGSAWAYGVSSDVLGRVVEIVSGLPLDRFVGETILAPLGMKDTGFRLPPSRSVRLADLYTPGPDGCPRRLEASTDGVYASPATLSGGAGLLSTTEDYFRFAEMLRRGGALDEVCILRESTVELMRKNHLAGDLAAMGQPTFSETATDGVGYGLGVSVVVDPVRTAWPSSRGEFAWGGYASTTFWVDPANALTVVFMTQLVPSGRYPIRGELRELVADALDLLPAGRAGTLE